MSLIGPSSGDKQFWLVCSQTYIKMTGLLKFVFLYFIVRLLRSMFTMAKIRKKCLQRKLCVSLTTLRYLTLYKFQLLSATGTVRVHLNGPKSATLPATL